MSSPSVQEVHPLIHDARQYALKWFNDHHDPRLVFHTYQQGAEVAKLAEEIGQGNGADPEATLAAVIAAWLHNLGFVNQYDQGWEESRQLAIAFLKKEGAPEKIIQRVYNALSGLLSQETPATQEAQILVDAVHAQQFGPGFFDKSPLLKLEMELKGMVFPPDAWGQFQLQKLLNANYFTPYAKERYAPMQAKHLLEQKNHVEKLQRKRAEDDPDELPRKFQMLERKTPSSGAQTFFRTSYRNHINLSAIADSKANIMISVNAILISVIISAISYKNITETNPMIMMPAVIFLVTGLTSLTFAVLSARPKVTMLNKDVHDKERIKQNLFFFGNFVTLRLDEYEEAMDAVFRDGELLYGNMVRDLYNLGQVLDKKYRYLTLSYNIFIVGFIATVVFFLIALIF
ncbi:MAG: Pycsar system effector family protein [Saprospiraceae bacterium]